MIKSKSSGQLIVISGPSGVGKDTVVSEVLKKYDAYLSISVTSRPMRSNDIDGVTYDFVSEEEFEKRIKQNDFLEYAKYAGNYYGTPKKSIKEKLDSGKDVILVIEIEGASNIKKLVPEALFIFIMPPSLKELVKRLKLRGTDSKEKIIQRFYTAYKEINEVTKYNYVVVNDDINEAVDKVISIIKAERCRVDRIEEVYLDTKEEEIHELFLDDDFINESIGEKIDNIDKKQG